MEDLNDRIISEATYFVDNSSTIRRVAKEFRLSKTTVFNDFKKLKSIDYSLYEKVRRLIEYNFANKHIRGGLSTKMKFCKLRNISNGNK